jgi:hypothetical protein
MAGVLSEGVLQEQASHLDGRERGCVRELHWWLTGGEGSVCLDSLACIKRMGYHNNERTYDTAC